MSSDNIKDKKFYPTIAIINPTPEQEEYFYKAINFCNNYVLFRNKLINASLNALDEESFSTEIRGKDKYVIFNTKDYTMYYCMARINPFVMKIMANNMTARRTNDPSLSNKDIFKHICDSTNLVWLDVNNKPFPMGIVPIFKIKKATSKQLNAINDSTLEILESTNLFNLLAEDRKDGVEYYLEYSNIKLSLQTLDIINIRNQIISNVADILGKNAIDKWEFYDEVNNKNKRAEPFVIATLNKVANSQKEKEKLQALPELAQILSQSPIEKEYYPVIISKQDNFMQNNIYHKGIKLLLGRAKLDETPKFKYQPIQYNGENYSVLYTDSKQTANFIIQHAPSLDKYLKNNNSCFHSANTFIINNFGNAVPIDYYPICEVNPKSKSYIYTLNILDSNMKSGYHLALINSGPMTQCYISTPPKSCPNTTYTRLRNDKLALLAKLKQAKADYVPLNDNGMPVEKFNHTTPVTYDQELFYFL